MKNDDTSEFLPKCLAYRSLTVAVPSHFLVAVHLPSPLENSTAPVILVGGRSRGGEGERCGVWEAVACG
jgi:hypothetical protein